MFIHKTISIANNFSTFPSGRFDSDSPTSGESFRKTILVPALVEYFFITIDLDGTAGYGSNWLEEAFGGLVSKNKYNPVDLFFRLEFKSDNDRSLITEILDYIGGKI